ncbi:MAG: ATP-binding protein [Thermodesulfobacteriota bacterium]
MEPTGQQLPQARRQLQWLLLFRVVALTVLLGVTFILQDPGKTPFLLPTGRITAFIAAVYAYTITAAIFLRRVERPDRFGFWQILSDIVFASLLIHFSGGSQSLFVFVLFFPIIACGLLHHPWHRLLLTSLSVVAYGTVLLLEYRDSPVPLDFAALLQHPERYGELLSRFTIPALALFFVGFLSSLLGTRLRQAEMALSMASQDLDSLSILYRQIFNDISAGIITVDAEGRISSFNRAAEGITGFRTYEVVGMAADLFFPGLAAHSNRADRPVSELVRKDGERIPVGFSWARLHLPDKEGSNLVYTFQDLSQIRRMEQQVRQSEKMASIGQMAAGIAHEFRNPLASISGAAQMLSQDAESEMNRRLVNIILRESERLNRNITEFLQFSKPAAPDRQWFSLVGLVRETVEMLRQGNLIGERCRLLLDIPVQLDCYADPDQLKQVFINLISNSCEAIAGRDGEIVVEALEREENGEGSVLIQVRDSGEGIDPNFLPHLFDPFFTSRENGTGLGLAIVWQIIGSHGGSIRLQNRDDGPGAEAEIILPLP